MRYTSLQYYNWRKQLSEQYSNAPEEIKQILQEWGIFSQKKFFVKRFINILCRPGRNGGKIEFNTRKFDTILTEISKINTDTGLSNICYLVSAMLNTLYFVKVVYSRQGSINVSRKVFLMPNLVASTSLKSITTLARNNTPGEFANQIKLCFNKDSKSKLINMRNEVHRLAKAGVE